MDWRREVLRDEKLRQLVARGVSVKLIGRELQLTPRQVDSRIARLGLSLRDARRLLFQREVARRDAQRDPIARALEFIVARGWRLRWHGEERISVAAPGEVFGPVWPLVMAITVANNLGAGIPTPSPQPHSPQATRRAIGRQGEDRS